MKYSWLSVAVVAGLLTGCSMYGPDMAPVVNNDYYGRQQASQQANVGNSQVVSVPTQPQTPQPTVPTIRTEVVKTTVTQERIVPPSVRQSGQQGYQSTTAETGRAEKVNDDGWAIRPQDVPPTASDAPKIQNAQQNTNNASAKIETVTIDTVNNEKVKVEKVEPQKPQSEKPIRPAVTDNNSNSTATETASGATKTPEEPKEKQVASTKNPPSNEQPPKTTNAVSSLLKQANAELSKGNLDGAAAYLNDASRIQPSNMRIRYDIANIRFHQGRYADAESYAAKVANSSSSRDMQKKAWSLIANARKARGDNQGAIAAAEKASSL